LKATGEAHTLVRELIDIGGVGLATVAAKVPECAVIGNDEDNIGLR
jgi:hypothetical protein